MPVPLPGTDKDRSRNETLASLLFDWVGIEHGPPLDLAGAILAAADAYDRSQGVQRVKLPDRERLAHEIRYQVVAQCVGGAPAVYWLPVADAVLALLTEGTTEK